MSILIGADIVPTKANVDFFISGDVRRIIGKDLENVLNAADYRIFNLETPLADGNSPIKKGGPSLRADVASIKGIKTLNVDLLTIANNHIMDQGVRGLESTIAALKKENISFLGAGENLAEASKPFSFVHKGKKIAVYACAEHEFSIAGVNYPGANPFDPLESFDCIKKIKERNDYVIVLYHGGKEYYRYPSPMLQRVCRKFVECGADLVVCQHSHCIGCEEKYLNATIVYGQGNFIFDSLKSEMTMTSLLIKICDDLKIEYIPIERKNLGIQIAKDDSEMKILSDFKSRSEKIKNFGFVESEYVKFAEESLNKYLLTCSGYNHKWWQRLLNRLSGYRLTNYFIKKAFSEKELLALRNYVECEAHQELLLNGLKNATH